MLGIVGESGAGKSTIGNAIVSFLKEGGINQGTILLEGKNIADFSDTQLQHMRGNTIAMIPQDPMSSLNPILNIKEHFKETFIKSNKYEKHTFKSVVYHALQEVQLPATQDFLLRYPFQISGGQCQRVIIALSLLLKPKILLADEPTTALDVSVQSQILKLLTEIVKNHNMAMIIITHNMGVVYQVAHNIIVMHEAKCVEQQSPHTLFTAPKQTYTKNLIRALPPIDHTTEHLFSNRQWNTQTEHNIITALNTQNRNDTMQHIKNDTKTPIILECNNISFSVPSTRNFPIKAFIQHKISRNTEKFHWHNDTKIIDQVSLTIPQGTSLGLIGESGAGKSTIAKLIIGLHPRPQGIIYNGRELSTHEVETDIQMIFQSPYSSLNPKKTLRAIWKEAIKIKSPNITTHALSQKLTLLLELVGLPSNSLDKYPQSFSGGQLQRICIARVLVLQPKLILCDEPTSALDISVQADILNLLKYLQKEFHISILFISHNLPVVRYMCDTIAVIKDGRIIETQKRESLFANPQTPYTHTLIESIPSLPSLATI